MDEKEKRLNEYKRVNTAYQAALEERRAQMEGHIATMERTGVWSAKKVAAYTEESVARGLELERKVNAARDREREARRRLQTG